MRTWWLAARLLIAAILLAMAGGVALIYAGVFPVGADEHWPLTHRLLETARERSVIRAARGVEVRLPRLDEDALLSAVAGFEDMCADCHAPPGRSPTALARGLNPPAPDLSIAASERSAAELYWVTRHGIRMTGMPAWGLTHADDELWSLVALIMRFAEMGPDEYADLVDRVRAQGIRHDHGHLEGHHPEPDHARDGGARHEHHDHHH